MCTTYTTKNRATLFNHYAVKTILVDKTAYCPCGPNRQDYRCRSRLYNPDPKYQCHADLTCHTFDSIPKATSCWGYGGPNPPYPIDPTRLPCFANGPCFPQNDCDVDESGDCRPLRCKRRVRRPPGCCTMKTTYRDLIYRFDCCDPCPPEDDPCCEELPPQDPPVNDGGYSVCIPKDACGGRVTYNCDPCGNVCRNVDSCGTRVQSECTNGVVLETHTPPCGPCGPCPDGCVQVKSVCSPYPSDPCCEPQCNDAGDDCDCCPIPKASCCDPCCQPRCCEPQPECPRPCKKPLLKCPLRTHNYCRCLACSPRFWVTRKPCE